MNEKIKQFCGEYIYYGGLNYLQMGKVDGNLMVFWSSRVYANFFYGHLTFVCISMHNRLINDRFTCIEHEGPGPVG